MTMRCICPPNPALGTLFRIPILTGTAQAMPKSSASTEPPVTGDVGDGAQRAISTLRDGGYAYLQGINGCAGWVQVAGSFGPTQWQGGPTVRAGINPDVACSLSRAINASPQTYLEFVLKNGDWRKLVRVRAPWSPETRPFNLANSFKQALNYEVIG